MMRPLPPRRGRRSGKTPRSQVILPGLPPTVMVTDSALPSWSSRSQCALGRVVKNARWPWHRQSLNIDELCDRVARCKSCWRGRHGFPSHCIGVRQQNGLCPKGHSSLHTSAEFRHAFEARASGLYSYTIDIGYGSRMTPVRATARTGWRAVVAHDERPVRVGAADFGRGEAMKRYSLALDGWNLASCYPAWDDT